MTWIMKLIRIFLPKKKTPKAKDEDRAVIYLKNFDSLPVVIGIDDKSRVFVECLKSTKYSIEEVQAEVERIVNWELSKVIKEEEDATI